MSERTLTWRTALYCSLAFGLFIGLWIGLRSGWRPLVNALLILTFAASAIFIIFKSIKAQFDVVMRLRPELKGLMLYTVSWHDPFIFWRHRKEIRTMPEGHWIRWTWLYMLVLIAVFVFLILAVPRLHI